jgi:8-oxo-dGTP pyrophosphatase MutT (NUDIX family)
MNIYALGILEKNSQLLLLLRQNTKFFSGYYGLMGGKIEEDESPTAALIREAYEEIGITITAKNLLHFTHCLSFNNETNDPILALVFKITNWHGQLINKEPDKCAALAWFSYDNLPENIIPRHMLILDQVKKSITYSESGW